MSWDGERSIWPEIARHLLVQPAFSSRQAPDGIHNFDVSLLNGEQFINLKPGQLLCRLNQRFFNQHDVHPREIWSTENIVTALNLVNCTEYFTSIPALCTKMEHFLENVVLFEFGTPPLEWEIAIVYPKTHILHVL